MIKDIPGHTMHFPPAWYSNRCLFLTSAKKPPQSHRIESKIEIGIQLHRQFFFTTKQYLATMGAWCPHDLFVRVSSGFEPLNQRLPLYANKSPFDLGDPHPSSDKHDTDIFVLIRIALCLGNVFVRQAGVGTSR
ncbi:hypothetical protein PTI98_006926 [Pleurotus ostreatus]|nr:hypothetical protein PTI98_006926 [Pleurotus ostreatus]